KQITADVRFVLKLLEIEVWVAQDAPECALVRRGFQELQEPGGSSGLSTAPPALREPPIQSHRRLVREPRERPLLRGGRCLGDVALAAREADGLVYEPVEILLLAY